MVVAAGCSAQGSVEFKLYGGSALPFDAIVFLRIACLDEADFEVIGGLDSPSRRDATLANTPGVRQGPGNGVVAALARRCRSIIGIKNECRALDLLSTALLCLKSSRATSLQHDKSVLQSITTLGAAQGEGGDTGDDTWRARSALVYRITRKALVDAALERVSLLNLWFAALTNEEGVDRSMLKQRIKRAFAEESALDERGSSSKSFVINYIDECFRIGKKGVDQSD